MRFHLPRFMTLYAYFEEYGYDELKKAVSSNPLWADDKIILDEAYYIDRMSNDSSINIADMPSRLCSAGEFLLMCVLKFEDRFNMLSEKSRWRKNIRKLFEFLAENRTLFIQLANQVNLLHRYHYDWKYASFLFERLPSRYMDDKDFVMSLVKRNGDFLEYISERLRDDEDVVNAAGLNDSSSIEFASSRLKDRKDILLSALQSGYNLLHKLSDDRELIIDYIIHCDHLISEECLPESLRNDEEVKLLIKRKNNNFYYCEDTQLSNELTDELRRFSESIGCGNLCDYMYIFFAAYPERLLAFPELRDNENLFRGLVSFNGMSLEFAS